MGRRRRRHVRQRPAPLLAGRGVKLDAITLFFGLLGGMAAFGLVGLFLGPIALDTLRELAAILRRDVYAAIETVDRLFARRCKGQDDAEDETEVCHRQVANARVFMTVNGWTDLQEHIHIDMGGISGASRLRAWTICSPSPGTAAATGRN